MAQWYGNEPGAGNARLNVASWARLPESQASSSAVHVCVAPSKLVAVTVAPATTRSSGGVNVKFRMAIAALDAGGGAVVVGAAVVVVGAVDSGVVDAGAAVDEADGRRVVVVGRGAAADTGADAGGADGGDPVAGAPATGGIVTVVVGDGGIDEVVADRDDAARSSRSAPPASPQAPATTTTNAMSEVRRGRSMAQYDGVGATSSSSSGCTARPSPSMANQAPPTPCPFTSPAS